MDTPKTLQEAIELATFAQLVQAAQRGDHALLTLPLLPATLHDVYYV